MAVFGSSQKLIEERQVLHPGDVEISERGFNLIIGGMLAWGFLVNYLMVTFFSEPLTRMVYNMGVVPFLIAYFALAITGCIMIGKGSAGLSFIGYNLVALPVGVVVCSCIEGVPPSIVKSAVLVTAIVTLSLMIISTIFPGFFLSLGRTLGVTLLVAIIAEVVSIFIFHRYSPIYEWVFVGIFSLYIGYDWARANTCARTAKNAIVLAASLYLDIVNLFLRILEIMSRKKD